MKDLSKRIFPSIIYVLLIFLCTHFMGYKLIAKILPNLKNETLFIGLLALFLFICYLEIIKILQFENIIFKIITLVATFLPLYFLGSNMLMNNVSLQYSLHKLLYVAPFMIALITIFKYTYELHSIDSSKLIFVVCYLGIPFALATQIQNFNSLYPSEIFYIFLLIWISDTAAYFIGNKFGNKPLAPSISPNKTIEGLIGGILFTLIAGVIIEYNIGYIQGNWIVISAIIALFAPIGDLAFSKIKRSFRVKDSSKIMQGHGGLIDRLDSFIGCIPFIYLYFLIF